MLSPEQIQIIKGLSRLPCWAHKYKQQMTFSHGSWPSPFSNLSANGARALSCLFAWVSMLWGKQVYKQYTVLFMLIPNEKLTWCWRDVAFTQDCRNTFIPPLKKKKPWIVQHGLPNPLTIEASIPFYGIFSVFLELDTYSWLSHPSQAAVFIFS